MKTVGLRVRAQSENALRLARFLSDHPAVERVHYPGLSGHPGHAAAARQMTAGFGGMLAFDVAGGKRGARAFVEELALVRLATSLGSVETTADLPAITSHSPAMIDPRRGAGSGNRPCGSRSDARTPGPDRRPVVGARPGAGRFARARAHRSLTVS
jgi:cystathionine beta-lyase/cystathionine gamma-synthase